VKFASQKTFGLIIDMEERTVSYFVEDKLTLGYSNIPEEGVHFFACFALGVTLTLTNHIMGRNNIENYLRNKQKKLYRASSWVEDKLK
jgi:hypothetical protein